MRVLSFTLLVATLALGACGDEEPMSPVKSLETIDVQVGTGTTATAGKVVSVHYTGWLYSETAADHHGAKFDSSRDRGQPFQFVLGGGQVIEGWDRGIVGMKVGGRRTLIIPPDMGYGRSGYPPVIPGNAALVFDVELLGVQ